MPLFSIFERSEYSNGFAIVFNLIRRQDASDDQDIFRSSGPTEGKVSLGPLAELSPQRLLSGFDAHCSPFLGKQRITISPSNIFRNIRYLPEV